MFTTTDYGKPISTKLSQRLRKYISRTDRAEIAMNADISVSLIHQVMYQATTLTENSAPAIEMLIQLAVSRCKEAILQAHEDVKYFENLK